MTLPGTCRGRLGPLTVVSGVPIPGMPEAPPGAPTDFDIVVEPVPPCVAGRAVDEDGTITLDIRGVARFAVRRGSRISVDPDGVPLDSAHLRTFLLGTAVGSIFHQRGILPLHASTVRVGAAAVAIVGPSGAGKSTMAHALARAGCALVADDVTPVTFVGGRPLAWPLLPQVKLWRDALTRARLSAAGLDTIAAGLDKFLLPVRGGFAAAPMPLGSVVVLCDAPGLSLRRMAGLQGVATIRREIYRPGIGTHLRGGEAMFLAAGRVAAHVDVLHLDRPRDPDQVDAVAHFLIAELDKRTAAPRDAVRSG